ncbi:MAG: hypothetical protein IJ899_20780 [Blautia sp.]|nr:hypothetical protein [Blautia sp.]
MPINNFTHAQILQTTLDEAAVRDMVTGWMDANAGQVKYSGGAEVKIPKMTTQGLGDYDRDTGYPAGSITLTWQTREMTQDRGKQFQIDAMDLDENAFITTAAAVMGDFQRRWVVPEIDAYRISKIANYAITKNAAGMVNYGQTINGSSDVLRQIKTGVAAIRELGYNGDLVIHATDSVIMEVELALSNKLQNTTWSQGGINTTVPAIDGVPLIATPQVRMYTAITLKDGRTSGQEIGGYEKASSGKDINFIIMPRITPIAVTKQDKMRIFDPDTFQKANAWSIDYRRYHDLWILDNKMDSIYVSIKEAA